MCDAMMFPDTAEEFMEQYKIVDAEQVYTNGAELIPIFRMKQWLEHLQDIEPERKTGTWVSVGCVVPGIANVPMIKCTVCGHLEPDVDAARTPYCSHCGSRMKEG